MGEPRKQRCEQNAQNHFRLNQDDTLLSGFKSGKHGFHEASLAVDENALLFAKNTVSRMEEHRIKTNFLYTMKKFRHPVPEAQERFV
jgi:hypothetical protein